MCSETTQGFGSSGQGLLDSDIEPPGFISHRVSKIILPWTRIKSGLSYGPIASVLREFRNSREDCLLKGILHVQS